MITFKHTKKLLILGVVLLITGLVMISVLFSFRQVETVYQTSVDMTTRISYSSDTFRAEKGYWLDVDIHSTGDSTLYVRGQIQGEIFQVSGTAFKYKVRISVEDVYQIEVANNDKGRWEWSTWIEPVEIDIAGGFYLQRRPVYYQQLMLFGKIILVVGLVVLPTFIYMECRARQKAKLEYKCPHRGAPTKD